MKNNRRFRVGLSVELSVGYGRGIRRGFNDFLKVHTNCELVMSWRPSPEEIVVTARELKLDGLIAQITSEHQMEMLATLGIPIINVSNRVIKGGVPRVVTDDPDAGRMAARNLLERGFRNFGFFGIRDHRYSDLRGSGFIEAIEAAGGTVDSRGHPRDDQPSDPDSVHQWLRALPKPVAMLACNDIRAVHLQKECMELSIAIPGELAVLGVDDEESEGLLPPISLSSIRLDCEKIGCVAGETLLHAMQNKKRRVPRETLIPPLGVITRLSTDVFAVADPRIAKVLTYIHDHLRASMQIDDLVRVSQMSRRTFERRFQELMGRSPYAQILEMRIGRAKELLGATKLSTSEVAEACGLHVKKISEIFHTKTGQTPTEFRNSRRLSTTSASR